MKKVFNNLKSLFIGKQKTCLVMAGLSFKIIPVAYGKATVEGIEREACIKTWNVAVKTTEPDIMFSTHQEWMIYIQLKRAQLIATIADIEHTELTTQLNQYAAGVKLNPKFLKSLNS